MEELKFSKIDPDVKPESFHALPPFKIAGMAGTWIEDTLAKTINNADNNTFTTGSTIDIIGNNI